MSELNGAGEMIHSTAWASVGPIAFNSFLSKSLLCLLTGLACRAPYCSLNDTVTWTRNASGAPLRSPGL